MTSNCNCHCHDEFEPDDEVSDFECPECGDELEDDETCANEECTNFECSPFEGGGAHTDEAKWERQQMGISG